MNDGNNLVHDARVRELKQEAKKISISKEYQQAVSGQDFLGVIWGFGRDPQDDHHPPPPSQS
jgi:hypothetical protein